MSKELSREEKVKVAVEAMRTQPFNMGEDDDKMFIVRDPIRANMTLSEFLAESHLDDYADAIFEAVANRVVDALDVASNKEKMS
jgi:hypothetical protein